MSASKTCCFCEYFDGGGLAAVNRARKGEEQIEGDCLNSHSPRFQTKSDDTCDVFCRDSSIEWDARWAMGLAEIESC